MTNEKDFTDIELETVGVTGEFLSKVPDQYQSEAKAALHAAWKLGNFDKSSVSADSVVETNRQLLLDRSNVGIGKYGTTLTENKGNLRYWLKHALEECLDQANYLQRAIMELDKQNGNSCIDEGCPHFNTPHGHIGD